MVKTINKKYFILFLAFFSYTQLNAQHDSDSLKNILLIWNLEDNFKKNKLQLKDTSVEVFHLTSKEEELSILTSNLGNFGSANISDIFIKRDDEFNREFIFNSPYFIFLKNSQNVKYFNTRRPFTSVMHTTSTKVRNLQTINFIHTQNINPNFNIAANFDFMTSKGQTDFQVAKVNSTGISGNYNKDRYSIFASYVFSKINNQNSGGFDIDIEDDTDFPPPFMLDANILLNNQEVSATQQYTFGIFKNVSYRDTIIKVLEPKVSLSHNINLYKKYRLYTDSEIPRNESGTTGSEVYNNFYYSESATSDSTSLRGISNKIRFGSEQVFETKNKFGFSIILEADLKEYYNFKDYIILENSNTFFENNVTGELYSDNFLNLKTNLYTKYYFSGYRKNDLRINLNFLKKGTILKRTVFKGNLIKRNILTGNLFTRDFFRGNIFTGKVLKGDIYEGEISRRDLQYYLNTRWSQFKPDFFYNAFYSNHNIWENNFEQIQRIEASFNMEITERRFIASFDAITIKNHVYFNSIREPAQFDLPIYVLSANINKTIKLNKLFIKNNLYWQNSSNLNVISLPKFAAYHSSYLKFQFKNTLLTYLGYEAYFSSKYKALSFNPSTGQFFLEDVNAQIIGNYPFIGLFMNLKIKKNVLMSFKFQHVNDGFLKEIYPVQINNYPVYGRLFKFSIKWTFKD